MLIKMCSSARSSPPFRVDMWKGRELPAHRATRPNVAWRQDPKFLRLKVVPEQKQSRRIKARGETCFWFQVRHLLSLRETGKNIYSLINRYRWSFGFRIVRNISNFSCKTSPFVPAVCQEGKGGDKDSLRH